MHAVAFVRQDLSLGHIILVGEALGPPLNVNLINSEMFFEMFNIVERFMIFVFVSSLRKVLHREFVSHFFVTRTF